MVPKQDALKNEPGWILHHYPQSPVAQKVRLVLGLTGTPWSSVEIPRIPPKPLLTPLTANYRRTPVLQRGADVYCDSQNCVRALAEHGFSHEIFAGKPDGEVMAFASWIERGLFDLALRLVIAEAIDTAPAEFVQDRGDLYFGAGWTRDSIRQSQTAVGIQLQAYLAELESIYAIRPYWAGDLPSYADASVGSVVWFLRGRWSDGRRCLGQFPSVSAMVDRLEARSGPLPTPMSGEDALRIAQAASSASVPNLSDWASQHGYRLGDWVTIRPHQASSDPDVQGRLHALTATRVSIGHVSPEVSEIVVHFPTAGYQVLFERA